MQTRNEQTKRISFKDYYKSLTEAEKIQIVNSLVPKYWRLSTFYDKMNNDRWTEVEYEKLQELYQIDFRQN